MSQPPHTPYVEGPVSLEICRYLVVGRLHGARPGILESPGQLLEVGGLGMKGRGTRGTRTHGGHSPTPNH